MSHDYHDALPGFHADQILVDGCGECEARSERPDHGISTLDTNNFARAVHRAREREYRGLDNLSEAEHPLLSTLWSVWMQLERRGVAPLLTAAGAL